MNRSLNTLVLLVALGLGPGRFSAAAAAPFYEQGLRLEEAGRWEEAYRAYLRSAETREQVPAGRQRDRALSRAFLVATEQLGWFDEAIAYTDRYLKDNVDGYCHRQRGYFYKSTLHDFDRAREEFRLSYEDYMAVEGRLYDALFSLELQAGCYQRQLYEMEYYSNRKYRQSYTRQAHEILLKGFALVDQVENEGERNRIRNIYLKSLADVCGRSWYSGYDPDLVAEYERELKAQESGAATPFQRCHAEYAKLADAKKWAEAAQLWEDYARTWPETSNSLSFTKRVAKCYGNAQDWENQLRVSLHALDLVDRRMEALTTDIEKAVAIERGYLADYERALAAALKLKRHGDVFEIMERSRARAMLDLLGNRDYSKREARLSADERELLLLKTRIDEIQDAIEKERAAGRPEEMASLQRSLVVAEDASAEIRRRADVARREILTPRRMDPVTAQEAQELIGEDTLIYTFAGIYQVVLTKDKIVSREMRGHSFFEKLIGDYRKAIERQEARSRALVLQPDGELPPAADDELMAISRRLYDYIIRLVEKDFSPTSDRIYVVNDRQHPRIPYQVLHDGERYLAEKYALVYAPSMSVLEKCMERRRPAGQKLVALGNPDLGNPVFNLAYAEDEVKKLAEIYPDSRILTGAEASEAAVQLLAPDADVLHLACHGVIDENDPMKSHLRLAPDKNNDGYLTADEIMDLNLQCSLVTLSACDSGRGRILMGGDILGLTRAWIYAGTPSVLASLWKVDDRATSRLMAAFYENLKTHDKAKALQLAQIDMIKEGLSPFYWAAFCLYGDYQ